MAGPRASDGPRLEQLAEQQAAVRRVATLVAQGAPADELFAVVAEQVGEVLKVPLVSIVRYEPDGAATERASFSPQGSMFRVGTRWSLEGTNVVAQVREDGEPARIDDYTGLTGVIAETARSVGISSTVGVPIVVARRLWGVMVVSSAEPEPLSPETEARLADFTELVATAIANGEAREEVQRLADEQAALRRVATLVARGVPPVDVFAAVAEEVVQLLDAAATAIVRGEPKRTMSILASAGTARDAAPVGTSLELDSDTAMAKVLRTGRSTRVDDFSTRSDPVAQRARRLRIRCSVAVPIIVDGALWGSVGAGTNRAEFPVDAEQRLQKFTDLVATAIANAESREALSRLAEEQAALRRVATLVAEGASPTVVFDAVAGEIDALLDADQVALNRYEPGAEIVVLAHRGLDVARTPVGSRVSHAGESVTATVRSTGRPARMEHREGAPGALAELAWATGLRVSVGAPIVVDGRLWGITTASWKGEESPPPETEERMAHFAELLDTAIANADSRDQLTASRARLLTAADEARRHVVRDLHDGAQQRLVHTIMTLKRAQRALDEDDGRVELESLIGEALEQAEKGNAEVRELAHGILPAVLTHGGLRAAVDAVVAQLELPVDVDVPAERFPAELEANAYFVVAEALTNVVKHAHARRAEVRVHMEDALLRIEVRDDGIGGADPGGHGLVGMGDRVTARGGRLKIESPADGGTLVAATLPV